MYLFILSVKYTVCLRIHFLRVVCFYFQVSRDRRRNGGNNNINISDCHMLLFYYVIAMSVL